MATLSLTNVTGNGTQGFGLTVTVQNIFGQVKTPGFYVRYAGITNHRRVHQAAWMGVGFTGGGAGPDYVTWAKWLDYEAEYINVAPGFLAYGDTFFWETTPGTYCDFEVDY